jgi:hypothetical protein
MLNQHPDFPFLAMHPTAMSICTRLQCHHASAQLELGAGQANTYYPPHSGELHTFLPSSNVRRRPSVSPCQVHL